MASVDTWQHGDSRSEWLNLRSLDLFVTTVETGSLAGAARRRGISQPAASLHLQNLERATGLQLLNRTTRGSTPTPQGEVVAGWAQRVLIEAARFHQSVAALNSSETNRLRVIASYTNAEHILPQSLARLQTLVQGSSVALEVDNSAHAVARVLSGEFELGFVECPDRVDQLEYRKVAEDDLVVVVAPGHAWAGILEVSAATVAAASLVTREIGSGTRSASEHALARRGLRFVEPVLELGSTTAVLAAVRRGDAPAIVSRLAAQPHLDNKVLVEVRVPELDLSRELHAVWRKSQRLSPLAKGLLANLVSDL